MSGQIVSVTLSTGAEVIGRLKTENSKTVVIAGAVVVHVQRDNRGNVGVVFAPPRIAVGPENDLTIQTGQVMFSPTPVSKEMEAEYIRATTGIEIAPANTIITG